MVPTTGWLPGRDKNHWLIWLSTIGAMLYLEQWSSIMIIVMVYYIFEDFKKDADNFREHAYLYKLILSGVLLAMAWTHPVAFLVVMPVIAYMMVLSRKPNNLFVQNMPALVEEICSLQSLRFLCLLVFINFSRYIWDNIGLGYFGSDCYGEAFFDISTVCQLLSLGPLMAFLTILGSSICLKKLVVGIKSARVLRFFRNEWQDFTFYGLLIAQISFVISVICTPNGPGDWLVNWLVSSGHDANLIWYNPLIYETAPPPSMLSGLSQVVTTSTFNLPVYLKSGLTLIFSIILLPRMIRISAFSTAFASRIRFQFSPQAWVEDFLEVLRQPAQKLGLKEAMPWLHHASTTFFWLLFCYAVLFLMVTATPGPLGDAIANWLDFAFSDAGFKPHSLTNYPQLRIFVASLVAMMGLVPMAVMGCAFLPSMKSKYISLTSDGILLPQGPYASLWFRPMRAWSDMRSVVLKGKQGETRPHKRTLVISFFSGGSLKLKLHQLNEKDLYDLLSAIDEHADECFIAPEVLELRRTLAESNGAKALPEQGQLRNLPADNFRSTVFVPFEVGQSIPNTTMRIVRQLSAKQLSAVYLVRLEDGRLAVAKQFSFPENNPQAERMRKVFLREYELLSGLHHQRIAKVLQVFEQGNSSILVLEHAKGRDLRDVVEKDGVRSEAAVIEIAQQICEVMIYLHEQTPAVLHRDLTPDNLVVDQERNVRLIDFGAAHQFLEGITGTLIGKQCYVAPEQLRGEPAVQSDIYSFGCTLYFLLTGEDPLALSQCDPKDHVAVSNAMRYLIMQCTDFDANERPKSFEAIRDALKKLSDGEPIYEEKEDPGFRIVLPGEDAAAKLAIKTEKKAS